MHGDLVWLAGADGASYAPGTVLDADASSVVVHLDSGALAHAPPADVHPRNPPGAHEAHDLCTLLHLNEACVVEALRARHAADAIYTRVGSILVAVNPWRRLPPDVSFE